MISKTFQTRYLFQGRLTLKTGLHIGGQPNIFSPSESPVIRTPDGRPFIPGSSFKGAFRSTVEKLAPLVERIRSCGLDESTDCIGPQSDAQRTFDEQRRDASPSWDEATLLSKLNNKLCHTCQLFGSPYVASKINFSDLYLSEDSEELEGIIQIRDGVAIDRDSERAVDGLLYEYEVVAPTVNFDLEILLEDPTSEDLGLICLGLSEFLNGFGYLGGKRSRGLGRCEVNGFKIFQLDLSEEGTRGEKLLQYLTGKTLEEKMDAISDYEDFIATQIQQLLTGEATHA